MKRILGVVLLLSTSVPATDFGPTPSLLVLIWRAEVAVRGTVLEDHSEYFTFEISDILIGNVTDRRARIAKLPKTPGATGDTLAPGYVVGRRGGRYDPGQEFVLFLKRFVPEAGPRDWGWTLISQFGQIPAVSDSVHIYLKGNPSQVYAPPFPLRCPVCQKVPLKDLAQAIRDYNRCFAVEIDETTLPWRPSSVVRKCTDEEMEGLRTRSEIHRLLVAATVGLELTKP
jgi:hypothetical protein